MAGLLERNAPTSFAIEERNAAKRARFFGADRPARAEPSIPGLGPSPAELAVQRSIDALQARHLPERRETDRAPVVGQPERMSEAANARLFPTEPSNDDDRGR